MQVIEDGLPGRDSNPLERFHRQREHWLDWLKNTNRDAYAAFLRLTGTKLGCEKDRLVFYLYNLKFHSKAARLSRDDFGRMMKRLNQSVEDLRFLTNSAFGFVLDDDSCELPHDVDRFLRRVCSFEEWASGRKNALVDDAKAAIVRHVLDRTKNRRHGEVSALIAVALGKDYKPERRKRWLTAHKMWVSRHRSLLKKQTQHEVRWLELKKLLERQK